MLYIYKDPETAKDAERELDKLAREASHVMMPANRRRLGQRRNTLNAQYDQLQLYANLLANKGDKAWEAVASRITEDKKILSGVKEKMQIEGVSLY